MVMSTCGLRRLACASVSIALNYVFGYFLSQENWALYVRWGHKFGDISVGWKAYITYFGFNEWKVCNKIRPNDIRINFCLKYVHITIQRQVKRWNVITSFFISKIKLRLSLPVCLVS